MRNLKVEDAGAFIKLAKELPPMATIIVFEKDTSLGVFKYLAKVKDDLIAVSYEISDTPYPVVSNTGKAEKEYYINSRWIEGRDKLLFYADIFENLNIRDRLDSRVKNMAAAITKCLGSNEIVRMQWTSKSSHICNLRLIVRHHRGRLICRICYVDDRVRALNEQLEKNGLKVIGGKIT
jgi:hypothetical protein